MKWNAQHRCGIWAAAAFLCAVSAVTFLVSSYRAAALYARIDRATVPQLERERVRYYAKLGQLFVRATTLQPLNADLLARRADFILRAGVWLNDQRPEARRLLRRAVEENPTNFVYHLKLGMLAEEQGRYEAAERFYRQAMSLHPTDYQGYFRQSVLALKQGRQEAAFRNFFTAMYCVGGRRKKLFMMFDELSAANPERSRLSFREEIRRRWIEYRVVPLKVAYHFGAHGFPSIRHYERPDPQYRYLSFDVDIQAQGSEAVHRITFENQDSFEREFLSRDDRWYEVRLDEFPARTPLSQNAIKTYPPGLIEELVFEIRFEYKLLK
ncbi:MAG: tetratricopeptide repeat protein [Candidatus Omnitrophica bacterium]|nr:tetratricopeptide repeat protein [Candidatus Omnitrophota bacterium]